MVLSFGMMVCDTLLRPVDRDALSRDCTMIENRYRPAAGTLSIQLSHYHVWAFLSPWRDGWEMT